MRRLQQELQADELRQFALLLRDYRTGHPFVAFADRLLALYGAARVHLLPGTPSRRHVWRGPTRVSRRGGGCMVAGMEPFVPMEDKPAFLQFLAAQGGASARTGRDPLAAPPISPARPFGVWTRTGTGMAQ